MVLWNTGLAAINVLGFHVLGAYGKEQLIIIRSPEDQSFKTKNPAVEGPVLPCALAPGQVNSWTWRIHPVDNVYWGNRRPSMNVLYRAASSAKLKVYLSNGKVVMTSRPDMYRMSEDEIVANAKILTHLLNEHIFGDRKTSQPEQD